MDPLAGRVLGLQPWPNLAASRAQGQEVMGPGPLSMSCPGWLSALGGVTSGNWERASGFGPWNSWPLGCGFSQALLAISPAAVHTWGRWGQGGGPAGSSRGPCPVMGSGLNSDLGAETWVLGEPGQVLAVRLGEMTLLFLVSLSTKRMD